MAEQLHRAYSTFEIKSMHDDDDERIIEGIASTPTPDRVDDVVDPKGVQFQLPMPFLWQHNHNEPVGWVTEAKATKNGIKFKAKIAKIDDEGDLKRSVDKAWHSIKSGLVRAVSIGFRSLEHSVMENGGYRFLSWEWFELSGVTIPMNAEASINVIRSIDHDTRAAFGTKGVKSVDKRKSPGVSGTPKVKLVTPKENIMATKSIADQIAEFDATRQNKHAEMSEMMEKATEAGETFSGEEAEAYDLLESEIKAIDEHVARLETLEASNIKTAAPVEGVKDVKGATNVRKSLPAVAKAPSLPKGTTFARYAMALGAANGNRGEAVEIAKRWDNSSPEVGRVLKAAVAAGTTTAAGWAAELVDYQNMASEFIDLLRPETILGKMTGLRNVPFNIKIPGAASGSNVSWVGQGQAKPVSAMAFNQMTLGIFKTAGIVVMTDELMRDSSPSAEALVRQDLIDQTVQFTDSQLLDPAVAEVAGVSPAAITNGAPNVAASGTTADALRTDFRAAFSSYLGANMSIAGTAVVMSSTQAMSIGLMQNALGQAEFPNIGMDGGSLLGVPVIASENTPAGQITFVKQPEILLADNGEIMLDVSREASLQMDDAPVTVDGATATAPVTVSLWQQNMVALRAERSINWKRRRPESVYYITGAQYV